MISNVLPDVEIDRESVMIRPLLRANAARAWGLAALGLGAVASAGPAFAADLPAPEYKMPVAAPAPAVDWTGYYVGGSVGYAWGRDADSQTPSLSSPAGAANTTGLTAGGLVGYNFQVSGPLVLGIEGDLDWTNLKGSANFANSANFYQS